MSNYTHPDTNYGAQCQYPELFVADVTRFLKGRASAQEGRAMKEKLVKVPGPDHPISIERNPARVVVSVPGRSA